MGVWLGQKVRSSLLLGRDNVGICVGLGLLTVVFFIPGPAQAGHFLSCTASGFPEHSPKCELECPPGYVIEVIAQSSGYSYQGDFVCEGRSIAHCGFVWPQEDREPECRDTKLNLYSGKGICSGDGEMGWFVTVTCRALAPGLVNPGYCFVANEDGINGFPPWSDLREAAYARCQNDVESALPPYGYCGPLAGTGYYERCRVTQTWEWPCLTCDLPWWLEWPPNHW